jgi:hypothetical protein
MIWYRVIPPLLLALVLSACAGRSAPTTSGLVRARGTLVRMGGLEAGRPLPIAADLKAVGPRGSATVRADRRGRFTLLLRPGTYRITITGHVPTANGRPLQPSPGVIHVRRAGPPIRLVVSIK